MFHGTEAWLKYLRIVYLEFLGFFTVDLDDVPKALIRSLALVDSSFSFLLFAAEDLFLSAETFSLLVLFLVGLWGVGET